MPALPATVHPRRCTSPRHAGRDARAPRGLTDSLCRLHGTLEFLLIPEGKFQARFTIEGGVTGNRWRIDEVRALFERAGFDTVGSEENAFATDDYMAEFMPRLVASGSRFALVREDRLKVVGARLLFRRR